MHKEIQIYRRCAIIVFHTGSAGKDRSCRSHHWLNKNVFQPARKSRKRKNSQVSSQRGSKRDESVLNYYTTLVLNDIIGNWFWWLLHGVFYETWNCWTKQKSFWTRAQKALAEHVGTLLIAYQYSLAWQAINYFLFAHMRRTKASDRGWLRAAFIWDARTSIRYSLVQKQKYNNRHSCVQKINFLWSINTRHCSSTLTLTLTWIICLWVSAVRCIQSVSIKLQ